MKYVYAILTVVDNNPIMQTYLSDIRLNGRQVLEKAVLTEDERRKYHNWNSEKEILEDLNKKQSIRVEIQEVEID